jgi:lipoprotein-anchoring transpeptidase ErfK/SrfK
MPIRAMLAPLAVLLFSYSFGAAQALTAQEINESKPQKGKLSRPAIVKVQILLNRARFSPGVIDGRMGENVRNALRAFREANGIDGDASGAVHDETWDALVSDAPDDVIVERTVTEAEAEGPFVENIPHRLEDQRDLKRLSYRSLSELLAEKYHMDQEFFETLNSGRPLEAGTRIVVANVRQEDRISGVAKLEVAKSIKQLRAFSKDGKLLAAFPATVGSESRPAPSGVLKIQAVAENPTYTVKPSNELKGVEATEAFDIAPGPNNPVGVIWIELSKESYGIHGTPEPAQIGKTSSHGCIRLTNWDAKLLAHSVKAGIPVHFVTKPSAID